MTGIALYLALSVIIVLWLRGDEVHMEPFTVIFMLMFGPFVVTFLGIHDFYLSLRLWYKQGAKRV